MKPNLAGYNLTEISENNWAIDIIGDYHYSGTFTEVILYTILKLGFKIEDLEIAIQNMIKEDGDTAHFGINRSFLYSFSKKDFTGNYKLYA